MKGNVIIRKMNINDYYAAYELWNNMPGVGMRSLDDSKDGIDKFLRRNPGTCFAAEIDGALAGTILAGHDGRRGYIYHTAVESECRRMGIGKALVGAAIGALRDEGINKVALIVYRENMNGIEFWESMGFNLRRDIEYMNLSINCNNK